MTWKTVPFVRVLMMTVASTAAFCAAPALGGTVTNSLTVTATVAATCSVAASSLSFGTYSVSSVTDQMANISVTCTTGTPYTVGLDVGSNASGGSRRMAGPGSSYLSYDLYSDSSRSTVWSTGASVSGTGNGSSQSIPVYGRIPAGQSVSSGSYADTVQITVTY